MQQQLLYRAKATLSTKSEVKGVLPLMKTTVVQLTLFIEMINHCERLVFVNRDYYFITDHNSLKNLINEQRM
jgi:hypothetical protein